MLGGMAHGRTDADGPERKEKPSKQASKRATGRRWSRPDTVREREAQLAGGEQKGQVVKVFSQTQFGASDEGEDGIKHEIGCQGSPKNKIYGRELPSGHLK